MAKLPYLKTNRYYKKRFILLIFLWFISLFLLSIYSYHRVIVDVRNEIGNKAMLVAGRYGGDEFSILLPDTSEKRAEKIAKLIVDDIAKSNDRRESSLGIDGSTVSIGVVSLVPDEETTIETLISYADTALYKSKRHGRNRVYTWKKKALSKDEQTS
ncbi:GGDEF domain-containing protein [Proteiniborus sp. MB09-C3]|uniref:GGDEF domain-containing protein n=1 Tax=Proteiniborus sp. MB09-C3 TaxID=3050072 RepID=UPI0025538B65|nr:GGDEF domain-containing protein [Proteiniborus sp. MB09-C3]WIV13339.1 GGDEF domain-containing protein [Proteiniborus sp. MB09-C3]